ncbi:hypothetical protein EMIHUDRAFT_215777 [Emiliania huxleyi CCMP1516]|uniref:Uncharacterized protein n=2 Tax=Emiliania huxleyi TaxID=2903 RepID=A0A0D3IGX3_EMIH1|nr:hypothetical protein EMIHUDRAFT_215777 [Emiliania huxleyi CCMP1516]EOD10508.1 hypothetical protein EMIHUDRAFT_215777 [Emiliania huxleyi CCMP1516]|eukprot:XP_005762937.1 hypothetical protein EMIHUDRAFT_215777 [Emiliania huxleyi CCMP1516]
MLALELLPTVAIAYTLSELVKPRPQRWVLLRHIRAGVELSSLLFSAGCGCAGLLLLLVVGALSLTGGDDADDPGRVVLSRYDQAALSEARSDAARELVCMATFTALAYFDLRARCVTTRLSWLWFLRAASAAAVRTLCYVAPLVAVLLVLPFVLLCSALQRLGLSAAAAWLSAGPADYCLRYGPYVSVYWRDA